VFWGARLEEKADGEAGITRGEKGKGGEGQAGQREGITRPSRPRGAQYMGVIGGQEAPPSLIGRCKPRELCHEGAILATLLPYLLDRINEIKRRSTL
jgi:hypothetical protein